MSRVTFPAMRPSARRRCAPPSLRTGLAILSAAAICLFAGSALAEAPWLGITYRAGTSGALVIDVHEDSAAMASGMRPGDEIIEVDSIPVHTITALSPLINAHAVGDTITITVVRVTETIRLSAVLTAKLSDDEILQRRLVGRRAPGFLLQKLGKGTIDDSILIGRVGLLVWFSPRCARCPTRAAEIAAWADSRRRDGLVALVATSGTKEGVKSMFAATPITVPVGYDDEEDDEDGDPLLSWGIAGEGMIDHVAVVVVDHKGTVRTAAAIPADPDDPRAANATSLDDVFASVQRALRQRRQRR
jgi:membrane-associated protease RseP (regulator of RpoE activity)